MGRRLPVLSLTLLVLLLVLTGASSSGVKARQMKKSLTLSCGVDGRIVSLSVAGEVDQCQGLTADMFVQVNRCQWKWQCRLKKKRHDQYMVKLFRGDPARCITARPKHYLVSFYCVLANVRVRELLTGTTEVVKDQAGIIRSHEDHPWLYNVHTSDQQSSVTLVRPNSTVLALVYTILTLNLNNDILTVRPGDGRDDVITYTNDVTTNITDVIEGAEKVTFQLEMSRYSIGGEGFVLCFQWVTEAQNVRDACAGVVHPGEVPTRAPRRRKGRRRGKGKRRRNQNKNTGPRKRTNKKTAATTGTTP